MKIVIEDVRLSFPDLFQPKNFGDEGKSAYSAKFIIDPKSPNVKKIEDAIAEVAKAKWADKADQWLADILEDKKSAFVRGPYKNKKTGDVYDGFQGMYHLNARTGSDKPAPKTFDRAKREVTARDGVFYAGCYVDAVLDIYAQDHPKYGRRINCGLLGVRFVRDGTAFSGGSASADDFADLEPSADADDFI